MEITDALSYDPDTGLFRWRIKHRQGCASENKIAGHLTPSGYMRIIFNGKTYRSHRLAFMFMNGAMPDSSIQVDHIDGCRSNNSWSNLRLCNANENQQNRAVSRRKKSGLIGVDQRHGRWRACIKHNGIAYHIGMFDTKEEAYTAYLNKKLELHTFNPIPRNSI